MQTIDDGELKKIKLFQAVDLESIRGLIDACTLRSVETGEVLVAAGQVNRTVYFILSGSVHIHFNAPGGDPAAILGPGESVAEMSVIDRRPASAFVVAAEPTRLLAMDEEILWSLVRSSHAAACNLLIGLTARLRQADAMIVEGAEAEPDYRSYGTVDALTGLRNRFWLEGALERRIERAIKGGQAHQLATIMIDIDYFKSFNERYGRTYGDHVLSFLSHAIGNRLRPAEIIGRYGGDEFVVLLPDVPLDTVREVSERIHRGVMEAVPVMPDGKTIPHPTISIGLAMWQRGQTAAELLAETERALARAKNGGRNCISE